MDDDWPDHADDLADGEFDMDVCQHCGRYFIWTDTLLAAWLKHWKPGHDERQPQRCFRCIVDDTWIEMPT